MIQEIEIKIRLRFLYNMQEDYARGKGKETSQGSKIRTSNRNS